MCILSNTYSLYLDRFRPRRCHSYFFFNDTATTEIYTLSLHDALPISVRTRATTPHSSSPRRSPRRTKAGSSRRSRDRKSTRLNSSHVKISYAVFCLKKKKISTFTINDDNLLVVIHRPRSIPVCSTSSS